MNKINNDIYRVGVSDFVTDLFEGQYPIKKGISYNSYIIVDEKIAVIDTVEVNFKEEWLQNVKEVLGDKKPDYLIVQHMEPDHSANIVEFLKLYDDVTVVGNVKTFKMIEQFFDYEIKNKLVVSEKDTLCLGKHTLQFILAPMVHWPEVMVTYEMTDKILFSADAFGKFDVTEDVKDWITEARRYYFGIVGKYGMQVNKLLEKAKGLEIKIICPLHGPILNENLSYYLDVYKKWASYLPESDGVAIFYTSIYGNTKKAIELLTNKLKEKGCEDVVVYDLARTDVTLAVSEAFKYQNIVLGTTTYNNSIFPYMRTFITHLVERGYQNRNIGIVENGTWAINAGNEIKKCFEGSKMINILPTVVSILSAVKKENLLEIEALAKELLEK